MTSAHMRCIIDLRQQNFKNDEKYGAKNGKRIVKLCGAVIRLRK
jgi:hypothetical protein